ncbi:uncharacterized protein LOC135164743 [Diachasmimorpha longicaudata]|uniref:uncharacterized protein LOC135164743 n=1 Tax=Diachasmimorpha longicaudata TaxID=58733 RepID=UPI0030B86D01
MHYLNMKIYILLSLIIGTYGYTDWTSDLAAKLQRMTAGIQQNVHQLQERIQADIRDRLAGIDHLNQDINQRVAEITKEAEQSGPLVIINSNGGSSRFITSGYLPNGEPYFRDVEERRIGDTIHRFERVYNSTNQKVETYHTTLVDVNNPNAKPVVVAQENQAPEPAEATPSEAQEQTAQTKQV